MNESGPPETKGHLFPVGSLSLAQEEEPRGEGPSVPYCIWENCRGGRWRGPSPGMKARVEAQFIP